jgi:hypothetical protein
MQNLYAVDFDVSHVDADRAADVYDLLVRHVHEWMAWGSSGCPAIEELESPGEAEYTRIRYGGVEHDPLTVSWRSAASAGVDAFRVDVRQPLEGEGTWFRTRVTVSRSGVGVTLRVVLGREITTGWLSPVPIAIVRRPRLVLSVTRDPQLCVRVFNQVVDDRYIKIKDEGQLDSLLSGIRSTKRLPILVCSPAVKDDYEFPSRAAAELQGLARVVTVRGPLTPRFNRELTEFQLPFRGMRLYWPDLTLRQPYFSADELARDGAVATVRKLMRLLTPSSVIARSRDVGWDTAVNAEREQRAEEVRLRLSEARASGDRQAEVDLLAEQVKMQQAKTLEWEEWNAALLAENDQLKGEIQKVETYRFQVDHWKEAYFRLLRESGTAGSEDWADAPALDGTDALFQFLAQRSDGALGFTKNAVRSWRESKYPFPEDMAHALALLAKAAVEYRKEDGAVGQRLDEWMYERHGLKVAVNDKGLERAGEDQFEHEGRFHSRVPHVKLGDHTSPDRVGRVYFGIDKEEVRFIVDHVGLKLYGL